MAKPVDYYFLELKYILAFGQSRANCDTDMTAIYRDIEGQGSVERLTVRKIDR